MRLNISPIFILLALLFVVNIQKNNVLLFGVKETHEKEHILRDAKHKTREGKCFFENSQTSRVARGMKIGDMLYRMFFFLII